MLFEKQNHQYECVNQIMTALKGVDFSQNDFATLSDNINKIAANSHYSIAPCVNKKRLDVLMETGTGKTFAYLQTIFEINKQFGKTQFIVVLPRTAIKLGVIQNIKLTDEYFFNIYGKHLKYIDYPQDGLNSIEQNFINSSDLSVLIITNSAFNSDKNNINKQSESMFRFGSIWHGIVDKKPIVMIDEPHLLKGSKTSNYLSQLDSLFIRFGATYPTEKPHQLANLVYSLDSISAFNQYLVKRIGVSTIFTHSEVSGLSVHNIKPKISFDVFYNRNEQLHKSTVRLHDDLGAKTMLDDYQGVSVVKINKDKIFLSNNTLALGKGDYALSEVEIRQMIKHSIELHFAKEEKLFTQNIKALSLFFIPKIDDFRGGNPRIKHIFEAEYKTIRDTVYAQTSNAKYKKYLDKDYKDSVLQVHNGYFSGDKGSKENKETDGVNLILNEKEKLLSFDTPLRFIFSVWALQEGWDNPNIFTICKLSSTDKDTSRRQQVGRGLRIAVNQAGRRMTYQHLGEKESQFYDINTLNMVVSGQEQDFIHRIQTEIMEASFSIVGDNLSQQQLTSKGLSTREASHLLDILEDKGIIVYQSSSEDYQIQSPIRGFLNAHQADFSVNKISHERFEVIKQIFTNNQQNTVKDNNKADKTVKIKREQWQRFKDLWEAINKKSKIVYQGINEQYIIDKISADFNQERIIPVTIKITEDTYNTQTNQVERLSDKYYDGEAYFQRQPLAEFIKQFVKDENLPLSFILELFTKINLTQFYNDPKKSQQLLKDLIKNTIHNHIIQSVNYEFSQTTIYANELQNKKGELIGEIEYGKLGKFYNSHTPKDAFLFDTLVYDSNIEKDSILNDPTNINSNKITVFAKLPKINIPTPFKTYNPDFAYLIERTNGKQLFLIVETKGYKYEGDIPTDEQQKINYGKCFFKALQKELPNIEIKYQTRINGQELGDLLQQISS